MSGEIKVISRIDTEEKWAVNIVVPLKGRPIIYNQGKDLTTSTVEIYSDVDIAPGTEIYAEGYSGTVVDSIRSVSVSGTPYYVIQLSSLGDD